MKIIFVARVFIYHFEFNLEVDNIVVEYYAKFYNRAFKFNHFNWGIIIVIRVSMKKKLTVIAHLIMFITFRKYFLDFLFDFARPNMTWFGGLGWKNNFYPHLSAFLL